MNESPKVRAWVEGTRPAATRRPAFKVRRVHQIMTALFDEECGGLLTQTQLVALLSLLHQPGVDQIGLAALMGHDRSTVGLVVKTLEKAGYITRSSHPGDRRRKTIVITPAGEEVLALGLAKARNVQHRIWTVLTEEEARQLDRLLLKIVDAFSSKIRTPAAPGGPNFRSVFEDD